MAAPVVFGARRNLLFPGSTEVAARNSVSPALGYSSSRVLSRIPGSEIGLISPSLSEIRAIKHLNKPVYSSRTVDPSFFRRCGFVNTTHWSGAILRLVASLLILCNTFLTLKNQELASQHDTTPLPRRAIDLHFAILAAHYAIGTVCGLVAMVSGTLSLFFLNILRVAEEPRPVARRYFYENLSYKITYVASLTYLLWCVCGSVVLSDAFCDFKGSLVADITFKCEESRFILYGVAGGLCGIISSLLPSFHWLGRYFRAYSVLVYLRLTLGITTLFTCWVFSETLSSILAVGRPASSANPLPYEPEKQFEILRSIFMFNNIFGGVLGVLSGLFGFIVTYRRGQLYVAIDTAAQFFLFWAYLVVAISHTWAYTIVDTYFANYRSLYPISEALCLIIKAAASMPYALFMQQHRLIDVFNSHLHYKVRIGSAASLLGLAAAVALTHVILGILGFLLTAWTPREWTIKATRSVVGTTSRSTTQITLEPSEPLKSLKASSKRGECKQSFRCF